jgi:hypothetical protein
MVAHGGIRRDTRRTGGHTGDAGVTRLMCSSESTRAVPPLVTFALAVGVELGIVGSWVSTVAASAVSGPALASRGTRKTGGKSRGDRSGPQGHRDPKKY